MMNRSRLLLLLLCLLGLAIWYAWQQSPRQERVGSRLDVSKKDSVAAKAAVGEFARLDFSGGEMNEFHKPKRDLFRPLYSAPAVVKTLPRPKPVVVAPPPPPKPKPKPVAPPPVVATKPIQPLTVLGFLEKNRVKTVFLASRQGEIFLVKEGDRFADDLLVQKLTDTEISIGRDRQEIGVTLKIGDKKNQRMGNLNLKSDRPIAPEYSEPDATKNKPAVLPGEK